MISTADLLPVLARADWVANSFCRHHAGPLLEQDDVRQDLLLDLLTRMRSFDPARSSFSTFTAICFRHRVSRLGLAVRQERQARHPAALDAALPGRTDLTLLDTITDDQGYGAWLGQDTNPTDQAELRHDLDRALSSLAPDVVPLCVALLEPGPAADAIVPRTTRHRRVRELRCQLLAAGIGGTSRRVGG